MRIVWVMHRFSVVIDCFEYVVIRLQVIVLNMPLCGVQLYIFEHAIKCQVIPRTQLDGEETLGRRQVSVQFVSMGSQ